MPLILFGQNELLDRRVTIEEQTISLKQFIANISDTYEIDFSYNDDILTKRSIRIKAYASETLKTVLEDVLVKQKIGFKQIGLQIVLFKKQPDKFDYTISGFITDSITGEALIGVSVFIPKVGYGVVSDAYGFYSIRIPDSSVTIYYTYLGYEQQFQIIDSHSSKNQNIELVQSSIFLSEVVVKPKDTCDWNRGSTGNSTRLSMNTLRKIPGLLGENDVTRSISILPGINNSELSSGNIYVRGGNADQTMFLMDDAKIFNAAHFGGFFSVFNPDIVNNVDVYKSDMPVSEYGAISSLIDVRLREGNSKKWQIKGGIGLMDAKASIEGPIKKDHTTLLLSFRRTYIDGIARILNFNISSSVLNFYFYDANIKLNTRLNNRNRIFLSAYTGTDVVTLIDNLKRINQMVNLRWNHVVSSKMFINTSLIASRIYLHQISRSDNNSFKWNQNVFELQSKTIFNYYTSDKVRMIFGFNYNATQIQPFNLNPMGKESIFQETCFPKELLHVIGLFYNVAYSISPSINFEAGTRVNYVYNPRANIHLAPLNAFSENIHQLGETYSRITIEPRTVLTFSPNKSLNLFLGYNRQVNPLHQLQVNDIGVSLSRWLPINQNYKPQVSNNYTAGITYNSRKIISGSLEVYYREMENIFETQNDSRLLFEISVDKCVWESVGMAYGAELTLNLRKGPYIGVYSFERVENLWKTAGLNQNRYYPAMQSRPVSISISNSFKLSKRLSASINWNYHTGLPYTPVSGVYEIDRKQMVYLKEDNLNETRMPDYHRLDLSIDLQNKKNDIRKWKGFWNFSIYNVYFHRNALGIVYFPTENGTKTSVEQKSISPRYFYLYQFVPSVSYKFIF